MSGVAKYILNRIAVKITTYMVISESAEGPSPSCLQYVTQAQRESGQAGQNYA
ncbi:hypothetical protein M2105_006161 [Paenibacillus sp. PastF-1]|nr:hypothetical protein [Paenibacillus sp. PastF-2]MDF9851662.1 hypothetical protein [Paenibacillus sp. PastM-2]MDF9858246.1 hypothetical protein [Paenibacillus sp. PastF-1]MDH6483474.1 hypothetical protein [Paenibacillus sp. PastH-2]MDH6510886.1 hypothetical protein [Paenibacillus sp. PastM-3]